MILDAKKDNAVNDRVNSNSNYCLFSELLSTSVRVRQTRAAAAAHPLEFEVSRCRTSHFAKVFPAGPDSCVE